MRLREERGSIIPMLIFGCFVGLSVIVLVVAATSLYIERKRLYTLADGAALAACESFDLSRASFDGNQLHVSLSSEAVRANVESYLRAAPTDLQGLHVISATSPDAQSARVRLRAVWRPPVIGELFPWRLQLEVTSTARTAYR